MLKNSHTRRLSSAHPRSRGEHLSTMHCIANPTGSSPLAQGTRQLTLSHGNALGIIPACAGNIQRAIQASWRWSAHPRSRGEHQFFATECPASRGASPLARGTLQRSPHRRRIRRLIPARAGNTVLRTQMRRRRPAHPRSRGEHTARLRPVAKGDGSSPLARGTRRVGYGRRETFRLIPARAGNTYCRFC